MSSKKPAGLFGLGGAPTRQEVGYLPSLLMGMFGVVLMIAGAMAIQQSAKMAQSKSVLTPFKRQTNHSPRKYT